MVEGNENNTDAPNPAAAPPSDAAAFSAPGAAVAAGQDKSRRA